MSRAEAEALKNKGNQLFKQGNYAQAIKVYEQAIAKDASYHVPYSNASQANFKLGSSANGAKAQEYFRHAADLGKQCMNAKPEFLKGYHRAANALMQLRPCKYQEVMRVLKLAYEQPNAQSNADLKSLDEVARPMAEREEKAQRSNKRRCEQTKLKGNDCIKSADYEAAIKHYTLAISQCNRPADDDIYVACLANRALCHGQSYNYKKVIEDTNAVLEVNSNHFKALFRRAMAFEAMNKYRLAFDDIMKCIYLDPSHIESNSAKNRIKRAIQQDKKRKEKERKRERK